ncbi:MAG: aromatic ring-hydroxylating dioxygenase subunit alpha [Betaproteobacteria bacterium]
MQHRKQVEILKVLMAQLDEGRNVDAGVQYRHQTKAYVCPERAVKEERLLFKEHPQLIGLSGDLPKAGSYLTLDDFGVPILATRDREGRFHAFINACRHRAARVASDPRGQSNVFMCPFHQWTYAPSGELINIPNEDHFGTIDKSCRGLIEIPAAEHCGLLFVHPKQDGHLDPAALLGSDLAEELSTFPTARHQFAGETTIAKRLNWKLANDTFGETYHFGKLHKDTLGRLFYGNNLHFECFGRHHRFVTASRGIDQIRSLPETEWKISNGTFVMYHLFPNIQFLIGEQTATLIRIYPKLGDPSSSVTRISFYYSPELMEYAQNRDVAAKELGDVYDPNNDRSGNVEGNLEVFKSTIEDEDYVMGEMQQRAAEDGTLSEIIFGRNEPALHHFHTSYNEVLGEPPLEELATR